MNVLRLQTRTLLLALAAGAASAQSPAQSPAPSAAPATPAPAKTAVSKPRAKVPKPAETTNYNLVLIDPGHGAADNGATFPDKSFEKDVTLALAGKLGDLLKQRGFTVVFTRTNSTDDVPEDTRVELANRSRPLACILLHAATGGHGVHLYTSALASAAPNPDPNTIIPWDTAQTAALAQSLRLVNDLAQGVNSIRVPLVTGRASVAPIDSLTCPAVAVELAPLSANGDINTPVSDPSYQQHVAEALTSGLALWRSHAQPAAPQGPLTPLPPTTPEARPKPRPKPKPIPVPEEVPDVITAPAPVKKPAPIVRAPAPSEVPQ